MTAFVIGETFESFVEFEAKLQLYELENNVLFVKQFSGKLTDHFDADRLQYSFVKFSCKHGAKRKSQSKGLRPNQKTVKQDCGAFLRLTKDKVGELSVLRLRSMNLAHSDHPVQSVARYPSLTQTHPTIHVRVPRSSLNLVRAASSGSSGGSNQERPISRFPIPDASSLPSDLQELMRVSEEKAGFVPNVFKTLSHRPDEMRAFVNYYDVVMDDRHGSHLTKGDKEMIVVAVSAYNRCRYCIIAHGALCRIFTKNPLLADQIASNWETADIDERQRAILTFAMEVAKCQPLSDQHFQALYQHGLDQEDAWDIGSVVSLFSLSNRMAFLTSMAPNEEFYLMGRIPKKPKV